MNLLKELSYLLNKPFARTLKQLSNNPISLTKYDYLMYILPNIHNYYITEKTDGKRAFVVFDKTSYILLGDRIINLNISTDKKYIFDCEYTQEKLYIFDVIIYEGKNVTQDNFEKRYQLICKFDTGIKKNIYKKEFRKLNVNSYQKDILLLWNKIKNKPNCDGIIFTNGDNYEAKHYKWKPLELLSIDFLLCKINKQYVLMVGISLHMFKRFNLSLPSKYMEILDDIKVGEKYFPVPFDNSRGIPYFINDKECEKNIGKIVECIFKDGWKIIRTRDDRIDDLKMGKYYGNDYKVAELTLETILNPIDISYLIQPYSILLESTYFKKTDNRYKNIRNYNNIVKSVILQNNITKNSTVMDLGSGKGQDLKKYIDTKVNTLFMLEVDDNAIDEIIQRKYNVVTKIFIENINDPIDFYNPSINQMGLYLKVIKIDLNSNWKSNILKVEAIGGKKFDTIVSNFAIHYFIETTAMRNNIVKFINHFLDSNGCVLFTMLNKQKVDTLVDKIWKIKGEHMQEYYIEKKNDSEIEILLPCMNKPCKEILIDDKTLDKMFKGYKKENYYFFDIVKNTTMLDEADKTFANLYSFYKFCKKL